MSFDLALLRDATAAHGPLVRIVITRAAGSAPRDAGTAMLVWRDGQEGTIGGGTLEFEAADAARKMLAQGQERQHRTIPLGPALGQCCGGSVTLVWESFAADTLPTELPFARPLGPVAPQPASVARKLAHLPPRFDPVEVDGWLIEGAPPTRRPLWIWGAGHVGRALVDVLRPLPDFAITWVDTGRDRFPAVIADDVTTLTANNPALLAIHAPLDAEHLILTYSHEIDLALCHALLTRGFAGCGLIGSATKWARFRNRLAALGHSHNDIARIACPIGDPALGKHPRAIALGVATSLLQQADTTHDRGAARSDKYSA